MGKQTRTVLRVGVPCALLAVLAWGLGGTRLAAVRDGPDKGELEADRVEAAYGQFIAAYR